MTSRNGHRPITARDRVLERYAAQQSMALGRLNQAEQTARLLNRFTWYKTPRPSITMLASRVEMGGFDLSEYLQQAAEKPHALLGPVGVTEHWAETLLHCPSNSGNRRTARFAGKPYHWRQDYTGQLKLAAGESPW